MAIRPRHAQRQRFTHCHPEEMSLQNCTMPNRIVILNEGSA